MVYIFFIISFVLYFYFQALDKHLKYFHESKKDETVFSVLSSPKKYIFLSNWRPNWVLSHKGYFWYQRIIESFLYFSLPFLFCTGFYSFAQYIINSYDNINEITMTIEQLYSKYEIIKIRINPYIFLLKWLFPLGIVLPILGVIFPIVFKYRFSNYLQKTRKLIFRTYYVVTVFSIFTFWSANEINRQNKIIAEIAQKIDENSKEIRRLGNKAAQLYSEAIAIDAAKNEEITQILLESQNLDDQIEQEAKTDSGDEYKEEFAVYLSKINSIRGANFWKKFNQDVSTLPHCCPPSNMGQKSAPDLNDKELPLPISDYSVKMDDRINLSEKFKHKPFEKSKYSAKNISHEKLRDISEELLEFELQNYKEGIKLNNAQKILKNATLSASNLVVYNLFLSVKTSFGSNPILECVADAIYIKTIPDNVGGFINGLFEDRKDNVNENLRSSKKAIFESINNNVASSLHITKLKNDLANEKSRILTEKILFEKELKSSKIKKINQLMYAFSSSKWERIRDKFVKDFESGEFDPLLYNLMPEKKERAKNAIQKWKNYKVGELRINLTNSPTISNLEDIFWNYAKNNVDILAIFQLSMFNSRLTEPFEYDVFYEYINENSYTSDFLIIQNEFIRKYMQLACDKTY